MKKLSIKKSKANFILKSLLLTVFFTISLTSRSQTFEVDINNFSTSCTYTFDFQDASNNSIITPVTSTTSPPFVTSGCISGLDHIVISGGGCLGTATYGSGGSFIPDPNFTVCSGMCGTISISVSSQTLPSCSPTSGTLITISIN